MEKSELIERVKSSEYLDSEATVNLESSLKTHFGEEQLNYFVSMIKEKLLPEFVNGFTQMQIPPLKESNGEKNVTLYPLNFLEQYSYGVENISFEEIKLNSENIKVKIQDNNIHVNM